MKQSILLLFIFSLFVPTLYSMNHTRQYSHDTCVDYCYYLRKGAGNARFQNKRHEKAKRLRLLREKQQDPKFKSIAAVVQVISPKNQPLTSPKRVSPTNEADKLREDFRI